MELQAEGGWRGFPGSGKQWRKRKRKRRKERPGGAEEGLEAIERRLQETSSELQNSNFWDSSRRTILKSLREHLMAGCETPEEEEKSLAGLENLHLSAPAEAALELGTHPQEEEENNQKHGGPALQCVCYGVGNFSSCAKARYQLAFLLLLLQELEIPRHRCHVFDPVFSTLEIEILQRLSLAMITENEEGKRSVSGPTVFYMIHCGKALYNNLLWRNWTSETLPKMAVIGNSFNGIEERIPAKIFQKEYSYIAKILRATSEDPFPSHPQYLDVFNDTAVHCFPSSKLRDLPQETWTTPEEPVYHDEEHLEIIRKKQ